MNEKERIELLISREPSAASFARKIGTTESSMSKLRAGIFKLPSFAEKIARAYPDLNCRWLLTGEGEPYEKEIGKNDILTILEGLKKSIKTLEKHVKNGQKVE